MGRGGVEGNSMSIQNIRSLNRGEVTGRGRRILRKAMLLLQNHTERDRKTKGKKPAGK